MASKASPPKPYELRKSANTTSIPVSSTVARSALDPVDGNTGLPPNRADSGRNPHIAQQNTSTTGGAPSLPARPGSYSNSLTSPYSRYNSGYSNYSSPYGSSYGSSSYYGSSYGSSYGSPYGSTYGSSYGSPYGSSYGSYSSPYSYGSSYGRYGLGYPSRYGQTGPNGPNGPNGPMDGVYSQMNRFGIMVEGFSRFSRLLDANFDALHGSLSSVIRLVDVFGEFFYVVKTFAVFRLLFGGIGKSWRVFNWLIGRKLKQLKEPHTEVLEVGDYQKFQNDQRRKRTLPFTLFALGILFVSLPVLFAKMWRALQHHIKEYDEIHKLDDVWPQEEMVRATFDYMGESDMDLPFRAGDMIKLIGKPYEGWWEGELNGRRGLFPANYVEMIAPPPVVEGKTVM